MKRNIRPLRKKKILTKRTQTIPLTELVRAAYGSVAEKASKSLCKKMKKQERVSILNWKTLTTRVKRDKLYGTHFREVERENKNQNRKRKMIPSIMTTPKTSPELSGDQIWEAERVRENKIQKPKMTPSTTTSPIESPKTPNHC